VTEEPIDPQNDEPPAPVASLELGTGFLKMRPGSCQHVKGAMDTVAIWYRLDGVIESVRCPICNKNVVFWVSENE
jgi:hypothetical protein